MNAKVLELNSCIYYLRGSEKLEKVNLKSYLETLGQVDVSEK